MKPTAKQLSVLNDFVHKYNYQLVTEMTSGRLLYCFDVYKVITQGHLLHTKQFKRYYRHVLLVEFIAKVVLFFRRAFK